MASFQVAMQDRESGAVFGRTLRERGIRYIIMRVRVEFQGRVDLIPEMNYFKPRRTHNIKQRRIQRRKHRRKRPFPEQPIDFLQAILDNLLVAERGFFSEFEIDAAKEPKVGLLRVFFTLEGWFNTIQKEVRTTITSLDLPHSLCIGIIPNGIDISGV